ncbi:MAG: mandelate racemase/muconate lactonizing enzyme family protein [Pseudomonadota bacterium]
MNAPIARLEGFLLEAPIDEPVVNAFGSIDARPALLVRVEDRDGAHGWGEVWCNFPPGGSRHRLTLFERMVGRWYLGKTTGDPEALHAAAEQAFRRVAIQCGEAGPIAQLLAGVDCALWDLRARRQDLPLAVALGAEALRALPTYASGIKPTAPERVVDAARAEGYRAFKLKLGFAADERNLDVLGHTLSADETLLVDLNQAWDVDTAEHQLPELSRRRLGWIEEPVPADAPPATFRTLRERSRVPLAGGENLIGEAAFTSAIDGGALDVVQPDLAKWGGQSGARRVAKRARAAGLRYCPHYLGGGVGLLHSAALLNPVGGDGLLEVDANPNPLRDALVALPSIDAEGCMTLADAPGLGVEPEPGPWLVARCDLH